jgi:sulfur relay (sulfurtransferase) complex TusBCD TusD component (DsrE family)
MQIELKQYNTVVDGLRQQLELARALVSEKIEVIKYLDENLRATRAALAKEAQDHKDNISTMADIVQGTRAQLEACKHAAMDWPVPACAPCDHLDAVLALRRDLASVCADNKALRARKRSK